MSRVRSKVGDELDGHAAGLGREPVGCTCRDAGASL
jgi:hypothetical protein